MNVTQKLANFVAGLSFKDLPAKAIKMAKLATLDTIGVIFAGARETSSKIMVDFVSEFRGKEESTVIGQGFKASCPSAALANGSLGHALDYDDTTTSGWIAGTRGGLHAGSPIVSAALAISERIGAEGRDFVTAITAAYDVGSRVAFTVNPQGQAGGWHPSGVFGTFAATAAAGKLLNFDESQIVNALGIAGSQASGILQCYANGSPMKRVQSGLAARNGVLSALLTERGLLGPIEIFEGELGFFNTYYKGIHNPEKITAELGEKFAVAYNSFKLYPVCSIVHSSIDAALDLVQQHEIKPEDVENVKVWVSRSAYSYCCEPAERKYNPKTTVDIEFNIPFAVAAAISKRRVTLDEISESGLKDAEILALTKKVNATVDLNLFHPKCRMEIALKDGRKVQRSIDEPRGFPNSNLHWSETDLVDKFRSCASTVTADHARIEKIIDLVQNLEKLDNITTVGDLVRLS